MTSQAQVRAIDSVREGFAEREFGCDLCAALDINVCLSPHVELPPPTWTPAARQSFQIIPARRMVCRGQDLHDTVPILCSGWAAAIAMLSDGSRQIISFLLPGDMISTTLLFEAAPHYQVEAVTDVNVRFFNRTDLKALLRKKPDLLDTFFKAWVEEKTRADQLVADLGRRTADERIARLILGLAERLTKRDMARGEPTEFEFPLRQHHIADATGLTPVHVSKVLSEFRRNGLINISERSITILDPTGFDRVANTR